MADEIIGRPSAGCEAADRFAIHELLIEYGRTIDSRDWDGLSALFGEDGLYKAGPGDGVRGPEVGPMMKGIFDRNPSHWREPSFHIFFNEVIHMTGPNNAKARSQMFFVVPRDEGGFPQIAIVGSYEDELVRKGDRWLFAQRIVRGHVHARHDKV
jgi:hypothetical protein